MPNLAGKGSIRNFTRSSYTWRPVPSDWDTRVGTARITFKLHPKVGKDHEEEGRGRSGKKEIGLFKIRIGYIGEIIISLTCDNLQAVNGSYTVNLRFQRHTKFLA